MSTYMKKLHLNSTVVKILCTVILGIAFVSLAVSAIVINLSKNIFVNTYGKSQERVFQQVEKELNDNHEKLMEAANDIGSSWAFRLYFGDTGTDNLLAFQTVYQMQEDLGRALNKDTNASVMIIGMKGESYINRAEKIISPVEEILNEDITHRALSHPETIQYQYFPSGFTSTAKNGPALIGAKALVYLESKEPYAVVYFTMRENDVEDFYDYFAGDTTNFYMLDSKSTVVSSDKKSMVGKPLIREWTKEMEKEVPLRSVYEEDGQVYSVLKSEMPYYGFTIYGVIDNARALKHQYNITQMVFICTGIALVVLVFIFMITRQITRPLSLMAKKMSGIREGDFSQYMEVTGTEEIQELATTYNYMLDGLKHHIEELMHTQEEKRRSEIKALQMQINPHYIYNTLTSIKWLIWQGDAGKSAQTIDAFIHLLRSTISNTSEYIPVFQEIINLKNYILINNTRYGDRVQVEFHTEQECNECMVPKLIFQPFIENAFFHAFPSERPGLITVSISRQQDLLHIKIEDDGIGIEKNRLVNLSEKNSKSEHFSGIGINNVDDRLKLLYGAKYGVNIISEENKGTTVTIILPQKQM